MAQRLPATTTTDVPSRRAGISAGLPHRLHGVRRTIRDRVRLLSPVRMNSDQSRGDIPAENDPKYGSQLAKGVSKFAILLVSLMLVGAVGLFLFRVAYSDKIYPAVTVGDVPVGGLTVGEAEARLDQRTVELKGDSLVFSYNGRTWSPTLAELGVDVDIDASLASAHDLGRTGDTSSRLEFTRELLQDDQVVPLQTRINQGTLTKWFDKVDADIDNRAINAGIVIEGSTPKITAESTGIMVDRKHASALIQSTLQQLEFSQIALPTLVEQPSIVAADLHQYLDEIAAIVGKPIVVTFENESWNIDPKDVLDHITVETTMSDGKPDVHVTLDVDTLSSYLNERFSGLVNRKPTDAVVGWSSDSGLISTTPSIDGATLKPKTFAEALNDGFLSGKAVAIPVAVTKPEIDSNNLKALGIENLISRGDSNFSGGDAARDTNIYIGAELASGTLIRPGADYSFNSAIGAITEDKGYVVSNVIFGETPGVDIGGGICQVSTTVFRAALLGGFPITEWHPHSFRISNYEYDGWAPGFDASILQLGDDPSTWGDFKFTNDTGGWLLVQTWASYPNVIVEIYGAKMNRTVDISEPWTGTSEKGALTTGFVRTVLNSKGEVVYEREFVTAFVY